MYELIKGAVDYDICTEVLINSWRCRLLIEMPRLEVRSFRSFPTALFEALPQVSEVLLVVNNTVRLYGLAFADGKGGPAGRELRAPAKAKAFDKPKGKATSLPKEATAKSSSTSARRRTTPSRHAAMRASRSERVCADVL